MNFRTFNIITPLLLLMLFMSFSGGCTNNKATPAINPTASPDRQKAIMLNLKGLDAVEDKRMEEAKALFIQSTQADPFYGPAHNNLGKIYYQNDQLYDAARSFEQATKLMTDQPAPRNNLGLTFEKANKLDMALPWYQRAVNLDPSNPQWNANYARCKVRLYQYDDDLASALDIVQLRHPSQQWRDWATRENIKLKALKQ